MGECIISRISPDGGARVGDVRLTTRNTLGDKWALCNGDPYDGSGIFVNNNPLIKSCWHAPDLTMLDNGYSYDKIYFKYIHKITRFGDRFFALAQTNQMYEDYGTERIRFNIFEIDKLGHYIGNNSMTYSSCITINGTCEFLDVKSFIAINEDTFHIVVSTYKEDFDVDGSIFAEYAENYQALIKIYEDDTPTILDYRACGTSGYYPGGFHGAAYDEDKKFIIISYTNWEYPIVEIIDMESNNYSNLNPTSTLDAIAYSYAESDESVKMCYANGKLLATVFEYYDNASVLEKSYRVVVYDIIKSGDSNSPSYTMDLRHAFVKNYIPNTDEDIWNENDHPGEIFYVRNTFIITNKVQQGTVYIYYPNFSNDQYSSYYGDDDLKSVTIYLGKNIKSFFELHRNIYSISADGKNIYRFSIGDPLDSGNLDNIWPPYGLSLDFEGEVELDQAINLFSNINKIYNSTDTVFVQNASSSMPFRVFTPVLPLINGEDKENAFIKVKE